MTWVSSGRQHCHTPDFFARHRDGTGVLIDVRPAARVDEQARRAFDATSELCATVGWSYRLLSEVEPILVANLRWLSGYRHPRHRIDARKSPWPSPFFGGRARCRLRWRQLLLTAAM